MQIQLIRHGKTMGNLEKRYIGRTDEPLCSEGIAELKTVKPIKPMPEYIIVSPMKRCIQTANICYPNQPMTLENDFCETDFGDFENQNYQQLQHHPAYQAFLDSGGNMPFPNGESRQQVTTRVCRGFVKWITYSFKQDYQTIAMVIHGGTIMTILEAYAQSPRHNFYHWQVKNAEGYLLSVTPSQWEQYQTVTVQKNLLLVEGE